MDQFDTFEILETKLINDLKIKDQINSLPKKKKTNIYILLLAFLLFIYLLIYLFLMNCKSYLFIFLIWLQILFRTKKKTQMNH